jgi:hypothetical protein
MVDQNSGLITATLSSGEPTTIRADYIAYLHPKGDAGCLVGFTGGAWMQLAESYETMLARWRGTLRY